MHRTASGPKGACACTSLFPFHGGRRRLSPDSQLFELGNLERELLAGQTLLQITAGDLQQLLRDKQADLQLSSQSRLRGGTYQCSVCRACLPTAHLLDCHITEVHDSFFAAQAARKLSVFQCLVEGCQDKFCSASSRKAHLVDAHSFPLSFDFERMHLKKRRGQTRPAARRHASSPQQDHPAPGGASNIDSLNISFQRLSTRAAGAALPQAVSFGRKAGRLGAL